MLIKLTDHRGKDRYLNPMYVKGLLSKGSNTTEVEVSGWNSKLKVKMPIDDVAAMLNAGMPDGLFTGEAETIAATEGEHADEHQAAMQAATGGVAATT